MGQTESLKKMRGLRKDIARVKTISGSVSAASVTTAGNHGQRNEKR